jgi:hypothetical protein
MTIVCIARADEFIISSVSTFSPLTGVLVMNELKSTPVAVLLPAAIALVLFLAVYGAFWLPCYLAKELTGYTKAKLGGVRVPRGTARITGPGSLAPVRQ